MQTGRNPNRSGMTTVALQGQGGGLPAAEWTLASVLKTAGYNTFFTGKVTPGGIGLPLPNAQGYDEMRYVGLYHLNAYTYADPTWFPEMNDELRSTVKNVTRGSVSAKGSWIGRLASRYRIGVSQLNADYDLGLDLTGPLAWLSPAPDVLGIT